MMYEYSCTIIRVLDGDTVEAEIDLGFRILYRQKVRLVSINAPELHADRGLAAKARLEQLVLGKQFVRIQTTIHREFEKYGRVLGLLIADGVDVNATMVAEGFAVKSGN